MLVVTVENTHRGWNYVVGVDISTNPRSPAASGFPVGRRITITNSDPSPTGSNATGAKVVIKKSAVFMAVK